MSDLLAYHGQLCDPDGPSRRPAKFQLVNPPPTSKKAHPWKKMVAVSRGRPASRPVRRPVPGNCGALQAALMQACRCSYIQNSGRAPRADELWSDCLGLHHHHQRSRFAIGLCACPKSGDRLQLGHRGGLGNAKVLKMRVPALVPSAARMGYFS